MEAVWSTLRHMLHVFLQHHHREPGNGSNRTNGKGESLLPLLERCQYSKGEGGRLRRAPEAVEIQDLREEAVVAPVVRRGRSKMTQEIKSLVPLES